jgi:thiamine biosynthesis lipoprotein
VTADPSARSTGRSTVRSTVALTGDSTADAGPAGAPTAVPAPVGGLPPVEQPRRAFVAQVMGLPVSVHVRGPAARGADVEAAVESLFAALRHDDALFSTWKPDSEVSRVRRGELLLADADARVRQVAALCEEARRRTDGSFDAWLPDADGVRVFDPTGLVKGWAVEQATRVLIECLRRLGPHDVLVSAGGDVLAHCERTDTPDWRVAIEDPRDRSRTLLTVPLRRGAVATSGTAARGEHIVDPATGGAPSGLLSATVIGPELTWADVYATAAFVRGADALTWLSGLAQHAAVVVTTDGAVRTTSA